MSAQTIYFVSDAHFGGNPPGSHEREARFFKFLDTIAPSASELFIMGDLFDFWIEYRFAIRPDYFLIIHELRKLVERGIRVHYLAGNHDFALGCFLDKTVGITLYSDHVKTERQGKRLHLYHGDGLIRADVGYRALRRILRNPFYQKLYKVVHPNIGIPLAGMFSGSSRHFTSRLLSENVVDEYRQHAATFLAQGSDIVVFSHTHRAELFRFAGGGIYCNTGAWLKHYNYMSMENGRVRLWRYTGEDTVEEIPCREYSA